MPEATVPLRGEVWDVRFGQPIGDHPAVVVSSNALRRSLGSVTVVGITGSSGPATTHIPLDASAGVTKYVESYANATDIHTVARARFQRQRGRLSAAELERLTDSLRMVLDL